MNGRRSDILGTQHVGLAVVAVLPDQTRLGGGRDRPVVVVRVLRLNESLVHRRLGDRGRPGPVLLPWMIHGSAYAHYADSSWPVRVAGTGPTDWLSARHRTLAAS